MQILWKRVSNFILQTQFNGLQVQQVRNKYVNRWMIRDIKRRKMVAAAAPDRLRLNTIRKNDILPPEILRMADEEIAAFPLNTCPVRMHGRCAITSRPRGLVRDYRLSRIVWRLLADYNKLSNVQRAMW